MYLVGFPLLVVPFVVYNIIEFLIPGSAPGAFWSACADCACSSRPAPNGR